MSEGDPAFVLGGGELVDQIDERFAALWGWAGELGSPGAEGRD